MGYCVCLCISNHGFSPPSLIASIMSESGFCGVGRSIIVNVGSVDASVSSSEVDASIFC